jgi:hypothetical protein
VPSAGTIDLKIDFGFVSAGGSGIRILKVRALLSRIRNL